MQCIQEANCKSIENVFSSPEEKEKYCMSRRKTIPYRILDVAGHSGHAKKEKL